MSVVEPIVSAMIIDCDSCVVREIACHDCVVSVILASKPKSIDSLTSIDSDDKPNSIDDEERAALALLSSRGMVPPLRFSENSQSAMRAK